MKRILIASSLVAAIGIGGVAWASASTGSVTGPGLLVQETGPLTVRGFNFDPAERVTLSARGGSQGKALNGRVARTAGRSGGFVAVFPDVTVDDCQGFSVRAVGSDGSRASIARRPGVCSPGPADG
jgi:hypothetical protein